MPNNPSLTIVHLPSSLNIGGAERFIIDLCQQQSDDGLTTKIMSFGNPDDALIDECNRVNIETLTVSKFKPFALFQILSYILSCDVIHIHSPYVLKYLVPVLPILSRKKIIYTRHGSALLNEQHWVKIHRQCMKYIDHMTFVSDEGKAIFSNIHGWSKINKTVIDNAIKLPQFDKAPQPKGKLRLGSVGRMIDLKNQISLLQAVNLLTMEEQQRLIINFFGDGPRQGELESFVADNLATMDIVFHGMVQDRRDIYGKIDVLVVTSETEGLSLAIIEAMASGSAIFASNVGGNPKLVKDGINGWLFEYNDIRHLAQIISDSLNQAQVITDFSAKAKQQIEEQFSLQNCAQKYQLIYLE
ncbi:glycosyltransferase family 4 protein [Thalassotalea crassostreae]|uniref:glycosyltransferase family 4 protein n=1 Tax=Thalassotalea crassostreae TaxID=1763536 RepID=UPI0008381A43|nr:glycosyltransferase family 4 protein [Thalassotalea crassostreae]